MQLVSRATDGARTRDLHLGKVAYYQLYYCRIFCFHSPFPGDENYIIIDKRIWQVLFSVFSFFGFFEIVICDLPSHLQMVRQ